MKVKDVIKNAAIYLADRKMLDLLSGKLCGDANEEVLTNSELKEVLYYVASFNLATRTIASIDLPVFNIEKVKSDSEAKIDYSNFGEEVYEVCEVVDKSLDSFVQFFALPFSLCVPCKNREYLVKYSYLPEKVGSVQDTIILPKEYAENLIALLMASDIFLSRSSYEEHAYFKNEYKKLLGLICSKKSKRKIMPAARLI